MKTPNSASYKKALLFLLITLPTSSIYAEAPPNCLKATTAIDICEQESKNLDPSPQNIAQIDQARIQNTAAGRQGIEEACGIKLKEDTNWKNLFIALFKCAPIALKNRVENGELTKEEATAKLKELTDTMTGQCEQMRALAFSMYAPISDTLQKTYGRGMPKCKKALAY
ncbi:hypothetical protein [Oryzomicrobium sp.]|uniref:hypothetical protein n=1 Tax=Oryzomicrobium sp. TaxID=1911578 RepID=UPI0025FCA143|nr:hypothetical protein [Oryzomicrobium sp.]MCE1242527.1 hypothetical protein [Oryzomicrobium sp.]